MEAINSQTTNFEIKMDAFNKHHNIENSKDEWFTPKYIIDDLGPFDLDPCSHKDRPWNTADVHYHLPDYDGLSMNWFGTVWLNPPYSQAALWLTKMAKHDDGITILFARTETRMFFASVWDKASSILFLKGRQHFHHVNGDRASYNAGAPSVLISYGEYAALRLEHSTLPGYWVMLK